MEHMTLGLQLLIVGMLTVFAILLIVIFGGKLLIKFVNMVAPEEVASAKKKVATTATGVVDPSTMAILQEEAELEEIANESKVNALTLDRLNLDTAE